MKSLRLLLILVVSFGTAIGCAQQQNEDTRNEDTRNEDTRNEDTRNEDGGNESPAPRLKWEVPGRIDTTSLGVYGFIIQGDAANDQFGRSVSPAGDVNGDGYADLIVAGYYGDDGGENAGEAYVIWGQANKQYGTLGNDGRRVVDTTNLGDAGFIIQADAGNDQLGWSVAAAGDVNGDGYADLIVGAPYGNDGGEDAGEAYVIWGQADKQYGTLGSDGRHVLDTTLLGDAGFIIQGDVTRDFLGVSVSAAGDVNGDGYADLIVGAPYGGDGGSLAGEAYVIWGQADKTYGILGNDGRRVLDTTRLGDAGFIIQGDAEGDWFGWSVAAAGDINSDGYADMIIGAYNSDDGGEDAGDAYVIWGQESKAYGTLNRDGRRVVDTTTLGDAGFIIQGDESTDAFGYSVSAAGDVNGDGYADLIIGAYWGNGGGYSAGEAYVLWGQASKAYGNLGNDGRRVVDSTNLGDAGFIIQGDRRGDTLGVSVSAAGDVNGDGYTDLIAGALYGDDGGEWAGEAYLIWGQASKAYGTLGRDGRRVVDTSSLGDAGFIMQGDGAEDSLGRSVATAGDLDGDGYADLIVGASTGEDGGKDAGEAYVIWGGAHLSGYRLGYDPDSANQPKRAFAANVETTDYAFDFSDLFINAKGALTLSYSDTENVDGSDATAGAATWNAATEVLSIDLSVISEDFDIFITATDKDNGDSALWRMAVAENFPTVVAPIPDAITPAPAGGIFSSPPAAGADIVIDLLPVFDGGDGALSYATSHGSISDGELTIAFSTLSKGDNTISVTASDADGDAVIDDFVLTKSSLAVSGRIDTTKLGFYGFIIQGDAADDFLGYSVSAAGDVNGDGYSDLIVGALKGNGGGENAGEAYVIWGQANKQFGTLGKDGRRVVDTTNLGDAGFIIQGDMAEDFLGWSVSAAGDVDGDGYADLIVGASHGNDGGKGAGEAYVIWGQANKAYGALGRDGRRVVDTTSLGDAGFIIQGDYRNDFLGISVSAAGDVNGDGFADLIVGAPYGRDGGKLAGEAYLIWGQADKANGILGSDGRRVVDTSRLGDAGFIIQGDAGYERLGNSVSSAGDVNGDGYADIIVGTRYGDERDTDAGDAYVIWGQASKQYGTLDRKGRRVVDTTTLGDAGFIIRGDAASDELGRSVSAAGDVNGDGYADLIVGALHGDDGGENAGEAYLIWGQASKAYGTLGRDGRRVVDTTSLGDAGFIIQGDAEYDLFGWAVAAAGDANGDGYADLIVGARLGDDGGENAGEAYVIWGQPDKAYGTLDKDGRQVVDTRSLGNAGLIIQGDAAEDRLGRSVAAAGDIDGDGYSDLIVGGFLGDDGGENAGEVYVIWGGAHLSGYRLGYDPDSANQPKRAFEANVETTNYTFDFSDLFINAKGALTLSYSDTENDRGLAASINAATWNANTKVLSIDPSLIYEDFDITITATDDAGNSALWRMAVAEKFPNLIAPIPDAMATAIGGNFSSPPKEADIVIDLMQVFSGGNGTIRYTASLGSISDGKLTIAFSTLSKGDNTFSVSATDADGDVAYDVFVLTKSLSAVEVSGVIDTTSLGIHGFIIKGDAGSDELGYSVSAAGDINGDGYADLIVGAPLGDDGGTDAGEAYVIWGQADEAYGTLGSDGRRVVDLSSLGDAGFIIKNNAGDNAGGNAEKDWLGVSVSAAGDVNGDGYADLIVGAPFGDDGGSDAGEAYVIWGQADKQYGALGRDGRRVVDTSSLGDAGFIIQGDAEDDELGWSVAAAGDVNGDGYADLIVGAGFGDDGGAEAGEAYLIWGQASKAYGTLGSDGRRVVDTTNLGDAGFIIQGDTMGDRLGSSVAAVGDVNGDGYADLIVGARYGADGGGNAGEAYVIWGQADKAYGTLGRDGRRIVDTTNIGDAGFIIQGNAENDRLGTSVAAAGDVNGDGYADLIVGATGGGGGGGGGTNAGEAYVIWGQAGKAYGTYASDGRLGSDGRRVVDTSSLGDAGFIIQGDAEGDRLGTSVAAAGDVNGDGYADLIVGAEYGDDGGTNAGEAYLIWGKSGTFSSVLDTTDLSTEDGLIIQGGAKGEQLGHSVAAAGDMNGDGYADLIVGAPHGGGNAGEAYVIWGGAHLSGYRLGYDPDSANQPKRAFDANVETTDYAFDFSDLFTNASGQVTLTYSDTENVSGSDATVGVATWDAIREVLSIDLSAITEDFDIIITATDDDGNSALWRIDVLSTRVLR